MADTSALDAKAAGAQAMKTGTLANSVVLDKESGVFFKRAVFLFYEPEEEVMGSIYWTDIRAKSDSRKFPLAVLTDVYEGKKTPAFENSDAPATHCVSIASKKTNQSLHLEAASQVERDNWVKGLKDIFGKKLESENAQFIRKGVIFTGYFITGNGVVKRPIMLFYEPEAHFGSFYWNEVRTKESAGRFPLHTVTDVFPVKKTLAMKSPVAADIDSKCCLSLESRKTEQGVHIEMPSEAVRKSWLDGLQYVFATKVKSKAAAQAQSPSNAGVPASSPSNSGAPQSPAPTIAPTSPVAAQTATVVATPKTEPVVAAAPAKTEPQPQPQSQPPQPQVKPVEEKPVAAAIEVKTVQSVQAPKTITKTCTPGSACGCRKILKEQPFPYRVDLMDGKAKFICRCGQSKNFPYCDGSHEAHNKANGTDFSPLRVDRAEFGANEVWICGCGHSKGRQRGFPFCDGSHAKVVDLEVA